METNTMKTKETSLVCVVMCTPPDCLPNFVWVASELGFIASLASLHLCRSLERELVEMP